MPTSTVTARAFVAARLDYTGLDRALAAVASEYPDLTAAEVQAALGGLLDGVALRLVAKEMSAGLTTTTGVSGIDLIGADDEDEDDEPEPVELIVAKELRRWRDNARNRVRVGKAPRMFASAVIPASTAARVWKALHGARTRAEVDAAFVVRKDARTERDGLLDAIRDHYAPLIARALAAALPSDVKLTDAVRDAAAVTKAVAIQPPEGDDLDTSELTTVLTAAVRDAYLAGVVLASAGLTVPLPSVMTGSDWGAWSPGWGGAADTIDLPGLTAVLDALGITIQGLASTTVDRLGSAIADGLSSGDSIDAIAGGLRDDVAGDADRAFAIADTEAARAMSVASMDTYAANDVAQVEWLIATGGNVCPTCQDNADAGPIATGDAFPSGDTEPPAHPLCRCAPSPVIPTPDDSTSDATEESD